MGVESHLLQQVSGITPVRRRECSQPYVSPSNTGQAPWTTSRCNRLLRPISSRIASLRKEKEGRSDKARQTSATAIRQCEHVQQTCARINPERSSKGDDDPDWAPDCGARKKLKRTYSSRDNDKAQSCARRGKSSSTYRQLTERTTIQLPPSVASYNTNGGDSVRDPSSQDSYTSHSAQLSGDCTDRDSSLAMVQSKHFLGPQGACPFRRLAQRSSPENWIPINGLYNGVDALLRATSSTKAKKSLGARSLFATCIRKIPQYILQEQRDIGERGDPEDMEDVALSVYTELESLSQSETGGWKPLRELIRSHGISLLKEAILDHSIPTTVTRGLVILCEHAGAVDEAEELVTAMLISSSPLPEPRSTSDLLFERYFSLAMFTLKEFAIRNLRYAFLYRQLVDLLSRDQIPMQWISSPDMALIWNMTITHMADDGPFALEAARLLSVTISKSFSYNQEHLDRALALKRKKMTVRPRKRKRMPFSNPERSALSRLTTNLCSDSEDRAPLVDSKEEANVTSSVTNLLTVLLTVDHVRQGEEGLQTSRKPSIRLLFQELEILILSMNELSLLSKMHTQSPMPLLRIALILFAKTILFRTHNQDSNSRSKTRLWSLLGTLITKSKIRESMSSALCGMLLCHAKAGLETSLAYFQDIQQSLLAQSAHFLEDASSRQLLRKIFVDAAFEFADETKNQRHLDWALELEETLHDDDEKSIRQVEGRTPLQPNTRNATGYRWEEGISEWIARTPITKFSHVLITRAHKPMPGIANPIEPAKVQESESPVLHDAVGSSPSRRTSSFYVRIETDRRKSALSHQCVASRTRRSGVDSSSAPPRLLEQVEPPSKLRRTECLSERLAQSAYTPHGVDELSTTHSSQETNLPEQEATVSESRPILREISNRMQSHLVPRDQEKGAMPRLAVRMRQTRTRGRISAGAGRPQLTTGSSSWSGVDGGESDDELGF